MGSILFPLKAANLSHGFLNMEIDSTIRKLVYQYQHTKDVRLFISKQTANAYMVLPSVVPTKSDSDVILCLQLLSKTLTCTLYLS